MKCGSLLVCLVQTILLIAGLFFAFFAWALDHADEGVWPATTYASNYLRVAAGYNSMKSAGAILEPDNPAFDDIVILVSEQFPDLTSAISQTDSIITLTYSRWGIRGGNYIGASFDLGVTLESGESAKLVGIRDLEDAIRQKYLDQPIFKRTTLFFALGLGLAFVGGALGIWRPRRRSGGDDAQRPPQTPSLKAV